MAVHSSEEMLSEKGFKRRMGRRLLKITLWALAGLTACAVLMVLYLHQKDYADDFRKRKGALAETTLEGAGSRQGMKKYWLTLRNNEGFTVHCGMLVPVRKGKQYPAIILMGGKATGKYAVDYALDVDDCIIVAPDYPYEPKASYTVGEFLADVPAMRQALLDMVPSVMLLTDYLFRRSDVDTTKVVLLGYSFGAPLVPAIIAGDRRAAAVAMVYGGGDLTSLIRHNVRRYESNTIAELVAQLSSLLLRPLEPLRYADLISPTPLIMINGTHDEQIPRANAELFYNAAREPKRITWLESRHVNPRDVELPKKIIGILKSELRRLGVLEPD